MFCDFEGEWELSMHIIRKIQENDIGQIAEMEREISIISFQKEAITDIAFHEKRLLKSLQTNSDGMFVVADEENAVGWLWMDAKENFLTKEIYINFRSFYIDEKIRGTDLVNQLFQKGLEYAQKVNAGKIVGKVHVDNLPMRAIYKNAGFHVTHLSMEMDL